MVVGARPFLTQVSETEFAITAVSFPILIYTNGTSTIGI
jgi:hypothetical protein